MAVDSSGLREADRGARPDRRTPGADHRADVEGLRAVAVLLVVAFHAGIGLVPGGYVGVDVFYVISGFLITGLLVRELRDSGHVSLPRFYARRARRLLPLATVVLVAVAIAASIVVAPVDRAGVAGDVRAAALWFSNWHFAAESTQYMADTAQSPVLHYWSLSVEEQFYVVWPLLLLLVAGRGLARRSWRVAERRLLLALGLLGGGSLLASWLLTPTTGPWAYFGLHTRAFELAAGALLALLAPRLRALPSAAAGAAALVGLGTVLGSAVVLDAGTPFPGTAALWPVAGTVLLLAAGIPARARGVTRALGTPALTYVGRISYGWYLWHWPCLVVAGLLATDAGAGAAEAVDPSVGAGHRAGPLGVAVAVLVSFALAAGSHVLVEHPVRRSRWLAAHVRVTLAGAAVLVCTSLVAASALLPVVDAREELSLASPGEQVHSQSSGAGSTPGAGTTRRTTSGAPTGGSSPQGSPSAVPSIPPADHLAMTPEQARTDVDRPGSGCFLGFDGTGVTPDCVFGDPAGSTVVALIGDSHALNWFVPLERVAQARHWKLYFWAKAACSVVDVRFLLGAKSGDYRECYAWRENVMTALRKLPRLDLVVVGRSQGYDTLLLDQDGTVVRDKSAVRKLWEAGARRTFAELAQVTPRVDVMRDTPWSPQDVPTCLSSHLQEFLRCDFPRGKAVYRDETLYLAEQAAARGVPAVSWPDLTPAICPSDPCRAVWPDGTVVFRDAHHLTATFAATLTRPLADALPRLP